MALISCPECEQMISDKTVTCPHCGSLILYDVIFCGFATKEQQDQNKMIAIKALREMFGLDLSFALNAVNTIPSKVYEGVALRDTQRIKQVLTAYGCLVKFESSDATRQAAVDFRHV